MTLNEIREKVEALKRQLIEVNKSVSFEPAVVLNRARLHAQLVAWMYTLRDAEVYVMAASNWLLNYKAAKNDILLTVQRVGYPPQPPMSWVVVENDYGYLIEQTGPVVIDVVPIT